MRVDDMRAVTNPFMTPDGYQPFDADSRLRVVKTFTSRQCQAALQLEYLQKAVRRAIEVRIRKLEKENH